MAFAETNKYLPIWNALKRNKICKITAPINQHKRIIKMVRRTRDRDLPYLFLLSESNKKNEIKANVSPKHPTVITFTLTERLQLNAL